MKFQQKKICYYEQDQLLSINKQCDNDLIVRGEIFILTQKFVEYQKDLFQDFFATCIDQLNTIDIQDTAEIKSVFEEELQKLNNKLWLYADKIKNIKRFEIKGVVEIIAWNHYLSCLIGQVSMMILRDNTVTYSLANSDNTQSKIDTFIDFVEWELESDDQLLLIGANINTVMDEEDFNGLNDTLTHHKEWIVYLNEILTARIPKEQLGFIYETTVLSLPRYLEKSKTGRIGDTIANSMKKGLNFKFKMPVIRNKLTLIIGVFAIIVLFLIYNLLQSIAPGNNQQTVVTTNSWSIVVDFTIDDIKREISDFQKLDSSSNDKYVTYQEIMNKLQILEQNKKRPNDVAELKKIITLEYAKGFNIIVVNALNNDESILSLNSQEQEALGGVGTLTYDKTLSIGGGQWALIGVVNNDIRGSLVRYNLPSPLQGCVSNLSRNGLYCYNQFGELYNITKPGVEKMSLASGSPFPSSIAGLSVYLRSNMYVLTNDPTLNSTGTYIVRYQNVQGSQISFQDWLQTILSSQTSSGVSFSSWFSSIAVDSTFLVRNKQDKKLYQLWRPDASANLSLRKVNIVGGDQFAGNYSDQVKVISFFNTAYVYFFDPVNQTFTVYKSTPPKTNDKYTTSYDLTYVMRLTFDLWANNKILDSAVALLGDKQELYVLTQQGVRKLKLYEYLDTIAANPQNAGKASVGTGN